MKWYSSGERSSPNPIQPITFSQNTLSQITFSQITYSLPRSFNLYQELFHVSLYQTLYFFSHPHSTKSHPAKSHSVKPPPAKPHSVKSRTAGPVCQEFFHVSLYQTLYLYVWVLVCWCILSEKKRKEKKEKEIK